MRAGKKRKRGKHTALSPGNEEFYSYIKDFYPCLDRPEAGDRENEEVSSSL